MEAEIWVYEVNAIEAEGVSAARLQADAEPVAYFICFEGACDLLANSDLASGINAVAAIVGR